MRLLLILLFSSLFQIGYTQVVLSANGPGDTYDLITSVLAPGHNPIETPDCNHSDFGDHIDEFFDDDLGQHVFRFYIHTTPDNDRCINFDRQRNEIKTYDKSPDNLLGIENENVVYKWKFKLAAGFQSSPNFTHLHQLKSVGGNFSSMPMYTLTTRKGSPDKLELRYAETDTQITLKETNLAPFIDTWVEVKEKINYGTNGTYQIEIKSIVDEVVLFSYYNPSINNWRPAGEFVRPKWGIYRSLLNEQNLRDEIVSYADFSIEEVSTLNVHDESLVDFSVYPNPVNSSLFIQKIPNDITDIQLINSKGTIVFNQAIKSDTEVDIDVSNFPNGIYFLSLKNELLSHTKSIIILH